MEIRAWIGALRLRTLPLALSCVGMGAFLAAASNAFRWDVFALCSATTVILQMLSNLANDYGDSVHGADHVGRTGPQRAVQSGAIPAASMRNAVALFALLALVCGVSLLRVSFGWNLRAFGFFLVLGVLCIVAAVTYTIGRKPYGYAGLGDLAVLVFFGLVGVVGSYYLYTSSWQPLHLLPAMSCGFFSMAVLNINNVRDIEADRHAGKRSIPVRMGKDKAATYHWLLLSAGWVCALSYDLINFRSPFQFVFVITLPLFIHNGMAVRYKAQHELDPWLRQLALSTLLFVTLFGVGLLW